MTLPRQPVTSGSNIGEAQVDAEGVRADYAHGVLTITLPKKAVAKARAINHRLLPLHRKLFVEANPIPVKWALAEMRLISGELRLPLTPLASQYHETVRAALREAGCL